MTDPPPVVGVLRTRVEWIDTDASGIYHNSTVTRFVEAAEARLMTDRGVHGYFPVAPRVRYEAHFEAPLYFEQDATVTLTLARVGTSSMRWEFEVWGEEFDGLPRTRAAHGSYVTVHIGAQDGTRRPRRSTPWPPAWLHALGTSTATEPVDET